eukprot:scaffold451_cov208-Pinguiococcus_pyrenoidosus.AAC.1
MQKGPAQEAGSADSGDKLVLPLDIQSELEAVMQWTDTDVSKDHPLPAPPSLVVRVLQNPVDLATLVGEAPAAGALPRKRRGTGGFLGTLGLSGLVTRRPGLFLGWFSKFEDSWGRAAFHGQIEEAWNVDRLILLDGCTSASVGLVEGGGDGFEAAARYAT